MSDKVKVSELNASSSRNDEDLVMIVQENSDNELENFKQTRADFMADHYKKTETYSKSEIDTKLVAIYKYRGTVASYSNLPTTGLTIGDVYNVEDTGDNYAWTGTEWDKLGGTIDLTNYVTNTDYATSSVGGVVKVGNTFATYMTNGQIYAMTKTYEEYTSGSNGMFIGKATLENVLNARIGDINSLLDEINGEVI